MTPALYVFIGSVASFVALSLLVQAERRREERLVLAQARGFIDGQLLRFFAWFAATWEHIVHYLVKLGWYYSLHSLIRTIMAMLVAVYDYLDKHLEMNRFRARTLKERKRTNGGSTHLQAVAEHKADVALSASEQEKLKEEKLEERD